LSPIQEEEDDEEDFELGTEQEEQETAWATNFSAVAIVEEEEDLIPPEANELKYVNVSFVSVCTLSAISV